MKTMSFLRISSEISEEIPRNRGFFTENPHLPRNVLEIFRGISEEVYFIIKSLNREGEFRGNSEENLMSLGISSVFLLKNKKKTTLFPSHHHQMNLNLGLGETLQ